MHESEGPTRRLSVTYDGGVLVIDATTLEVVADLPGHVVHHAGHTVLFADGTGQITAFDPHDLGEGEAPEVEQTTTPEAHHGVAVQFEDESMLHAAGIEETRNGAVVSCWDAKTGS